MSKDTRVRDIMTTDVLTTGADHTGNSCMELMTNRKIRHLPVVENGRVTAMVSIGDLVKSMISEQQVLIDQLQHYISG